jgi:hypothetical protein
VWPRDPQGIAAGWGDARLRPPDLARVGLLFLRGGRWVDRRVLPASWVERATRDHAAPGGPADGYGYQWWMSASGGYYASGRGGQYLYVVPALDLVVVTTGSASPAMLAGYGDLFRSALFPAIVSDAPLAADAAAATRLAERVAAAAQPPPAVAPDPAPPVAAAVGGRRFAAAANALGWEVLALALGGAAGTLELTVGGARQSLAFGLDGVPRVARGVRFAGPARYADTDVALRGRWLDATTLELEFDTIDRIEAGTITLSFVDGGAAIDVDVYERTFFQGHFRFRALPGS